MPFPKATRGAACLLFLSACLIAHAQGDEPRPGRPEGGRGMGPGGGPMGMMGQETKLLKDHDKNRDGRLDTEERKTAREAAKKLKSQRRGPGGFGGRRGPGGEGEGQAQPKAGVKVKPAEAKSGGQASLYDPSVLRTVFLDFEAKDWEEELVDFADTDVDVPATLTIDGKVIQGVGVHFRGASSYFTVGNGQKRSLNVALDHSDEKARFGGHKTLNLLNAHEDASFMHTVLYAAIAGDYLPTPKANFVRVVINGESWGIYTNAQQFDRILIGEHWKDDSGARWKVPGSPRGAGGLDYIGDDAAEYKRRYSMKSGKDEDWKALVALTKVLTETPTEELEAALKPIFDIDGALRFLAVEMALVNMDGYWIRASDYSIYRDPTGVFHLLPHDMNEVLSGGGMMGGPGMGGRGGRRPRPGGEGGGAPPEGAPPEGERPRERPEGGPPGGFGPGGFGPGGPGGAGGAGGFGGGRVVETDPLSGLDDATKPLRSRLLKVPALRDRYLGYVKDIAEKWLDWKNLGAVVAKHRALIEGELELDTRKLSSIEAFRKAVSNDLPATPVAGQGGEVATSQPRQRGGVSLREFAEKRRAYLLNHPEIKKLEK